METIKEILINRDRISPSEADQIISEAKETLTDYLQALDFESAGDICAEFFGLEPDFIFELM